MPLEISHKPTHKSQLQKTIFVKLGQASAKCDQLYSPAHLDTEISYNQKMRKFCPIKAIIKIYDVLEDGNELISCVGAFELDHILNDSSCSNVVEKSVGSTLFKF